MSNEKSVTIQLSKQKPFDLSDSMKVGEIFYTVHYRRIWKLFSLKMKMPHIMLGMKNNGDGAYTFDARRIPMSKNYFLYRIELWVIKRINGRYKNKFTQK